MNRYVFNLVFIISSVSAQFQYSSNFEIRQSFFNNNFNPISKPFRITSLDLFYTFATVDLISKNSLEYNWSSNYMNYDFREIYLSWYPNFGELKLGKQIIPIGLADGNNPSDNINPYNYNYLFLTGVDRKIGVNSFFSDFYIDDYQISILLKYDNTKNLLPSANDNSIFPLINIHNTKKELDYGIIFKMMLANNDVSLSYLKSTDYMPTPINKQNDFGYKKTDIFGFNTVGFLRYLTYRIEAVYFLSKYNSTIYGSYMQYTAQIEYETLNETMLTLQHIQENILYDKYGNFISGIGNPILSIFNNSIILSINKKFLNQTLNSNLGIIANIDNKLHSLNLDFDYDLNNNTKINFTILQFINVLNQSSNAQEQELYKQLENNSQMAISVKYTI